MTSRATLFKIELFSWNNLLFTDLGDYTLLFSCHIGVSTFFSWSYDKNPPKNGTQFDLLFEFSTTNYTILDRIATTYKTICGYLQNTLSKVREGVQAAFSSNVSFSSSIWSNPVYVSRITEFSLSRQTDPLLKEILCSKKLMGSHQYSLHRFP